MIDFDFLGCWFSSSDELNLTFIDGTNNGYGFKWMIKLPFLNITKIW